MSTRLRTKPPATTTLGSKYSRTPPILISRSKSVITGPTVDHSVGRSTTATRKIGSAKPASAAAVTGRQQATKKPFADRRGISEVKR